jgi:putative oxidoreductase
MHGLITNVLHRVSSLDWLALLVARLGVGVMFCGSGWGKLHDLIRFGDWFGTLGIPFPHFNAAMVAGIEFVGGACLVLGLGTRIFAFLLACTMVVALVTVGTQSDAKTLGDWLFKSEMLLIEIFIWMMVAGSGKVGIDHWIARMYDVAE